MNTPHHSDLGATLEQSRSGLRDSHRRSLMRLLFLITGSALVIFACLQFLNGRLEVGEHPLIQGVSFIGPVQGDDGNVVLVFESYIFCRHAVVFPFGPGQSF